MMHFSISKRMELILKSAILIEDMYELDNLCMYV